MLYRELLKRGVSEYLVAPITPLQLIESLSNLYNNPDTEPVGNVIAFIGAKGGVGSSTVCHNTAWALSEILKANVVIADLDLAFGTTGPRLQPGPRAGHRGRAASPERLDEVLLDRLLTKCSEHLRIFAAPVVLDRDYEISAEACDLVLDVVRQNVPYVVVDLPHTWTAWVKSILLQADEVVITAVPGPRQPAQRQEHRRSPAQNRDATTSPPRLVINMVKMPKRPEISVPRSSRSRSTSRHTQVIDFDAETFGLASNNGQMIEELTAKAKSAAAFRDIALAMTHRRGAEGGEEALRRWLTSLRFSRSSSLSAEELTSHVR